MRCLTVLMLVLLAATARAQSPAATSALCTDAIAAAERQYATAPGLLASIARVESGRPIPPGNAIGPWPWTIDADGGSYFFPTKAEAVAWAKAAMTRGVHYIDVGCMQIDLPQHPGAFRTIEDSFDPVVNVAYGARYLRSLFDTDAGGSWPVATGYYHSHTPALAEEYRARVASAGAGTLAGAGGGFSLYDRALRAGTLHLALAGGGMLTLNLNRQPARVHRHLSACQVAGVLGPYMRSPPRGGECKTTQR